MNDNSDRVGLYTMGGLFLGAILMAGLHGLPQMNLSQDFWMGEKSMLDYVASFVGLGIAITVALVGFRTWRFNVANGAAGRFLKGVELIAGASNASQAGGIQVLSDVARLNPREYEYPMAKVLIARMDEDGLKINNAILADRTPPVEWPQIPISTIEGLRAICDIPPHRRWHGTVDFGKAKPKLILQSLYLGHTLLARRDFTDMAIRNSVAVHLMFEKCRFERSSYEGAVISGLTFLDCDGVDFFIRRTPHRFGSGPATIELKNCTNINVNIAGRRITENGRHML